jgi:predicted nucleic acid-binding protein
MALTHLLDTSVYSQRLRREPHPAVVKRWRALGDDALAVSAICEGELVFGLELKESERMWLEYRECLKGRLAFLPVDRNVVEAYGRLKASLWRVGKPRGELDLWIGATALSHRLILATLNARHFAGMPGVAVEDWSL